jgi:hypothetical protein
VSPGASKTVLNIEVNHRFITDLMLEMQMQVGDQQA